MLIMRNVPSIAISILICASFGLEAAETQQVLTLTKAHEIALQKHPKISVAELKSLAAQQVVKQAASVFLPNVSGNVGAVAAADSNTRIVSGTLPLSSVYDRASASLVVSQLITDFGRSSKLEESARLKAGAEEKNVEATRLQILLQVDAAYIGVLQSRALLKVAEQTVKTRKLFRDQMATLAQNQLKSDLDASFAEVNYQDALLLQSRTENDLQSSEASLAALLDDRSGLTYALSDDIAQGKVEGEISELVGQALSNRPDLQRLRLERDSAMKFASAERGLGNPTLSVQGTAGVLPYRESSLNKQDYAAAGIVLNVPIYTGGLFTARQKEADLRARAVTDTLRDEETNVARDVRIALLNVVNARERMSISAKLLEQSRRSEDLAQAKFDAGTTSMVELGQAQLNSTAAALNETNSRYDYLLRRSILSFQTATLH